jgi:hypothetical protein
MQHTTEATKQYQCRHIFTDGRRCASPCLRQQEFCYYHHTTRRPIANPRQRRSRRSTFHLPLPEDRSAIQASIGEVLQRIASNDIDPRRAGLLLYGLQIASLNLPKPATHRNARPEPIEVVDEITTDPELGTLAPRAEVGKATQRKSTVALLLERMLETEQQAPGVNEAAAAPQEPTTIPTLQATHLARATTTAGAPCPDPGTWVFNLRTISPQKPSFRPKAHLPLQGRNRFSTPSLQKPKPNLVSGQAACLEAPTARAIPGQGNLRGSDG